MLKRAKQRLTTVESRICGTIYGKASIMETTRCSGTWCHMAYISSDRGSWFVALILSSLHFCRFGPSTVSGRAKAEAQDHKSMSQKCPCINNSPTAQSASKFIPSPSADMNINSSSQVVFAMSVSPETNSGNFLLDYRELMSSREGHCQKSAGKFGAKGSSVCYVPYRTRKKCWGHVF